MNSIVSFLLIAFFNISLISGCASSDRFYPINEVTYTNSIAYERKNNTPITGVVTEYSGSEVLLSETSYKDG